MSSVLEVVSYGGYNNCPYGRNIAIYFVLNPGGVGVSERSHLSPPYKVSESPKAVQTECTISCRVVNVLIIDSFGTLVCWILRVDIL